MKTVLREGDFLKVKDGGIFEVKGLVHPPQRVIAFIRYLPEHDGDRKSGRLNYRKVYSMNERYNLMQNRYPQFMIYDPVYKEKMPEVPVSSITRHYTPYKKVLKLLSKSPIKLIEKQACSFVKLLRDSSKVSLERIGITGSILVGTYNQQSDIDVIVYGTENCLSVHDSLKNILSKNKEGVRKYEKDDLYRLYDFRVKDTIMPFNKFLWHEWRKGFQGRFMNRDFFIRYIKDWDEINEKYGDYLYEKKGYAKIKAKITDASESIYTPCSYKVSNVEFLHGGNRSLLKEIVSFRGRFCEQAETGETVIAQGEIEKVKKSNEVYYRIILGRTKRDFMMVSN